MQYLYYYKKQLDSTALRKEVIMRKWIDDNRINDWLNDHPMTFFLSCIFGACIVLLPLVFVFDRYYHRPWQEEERRLILLKIDERAAKNQEIVRSVEGVTLQGCTDGSYMLERVQITNSNTETVFVHQVESTRDHCEVTQAIVRIDPGQTIELCTLCTMTFGGKLIIHTSEGPVGLIPLTCPK
ncbi:MAG: hypothetical protein V1848_03975 [Candidatus Magasanikbacteria bacterium]